MCGGRLQAMFMNGEGAKWKEGGESLMGLSGFVVTGCIMVVKMKTSFVSFRVYIINDYITTRWHQHADWLWRSDCVYNVFRHIGDCSYELILPSRDALVSARYANKFKLKIPAFNTLMLFITISKQ
jgi:hypothetical protein